MEYVIIVYSTVNGESSNAMGPYSEEEALLVLQHIHRDFVAELEDETYRADYEGATLDDRNLEKGFFSMRWSESEFVTYTLCKLQKAGGGLV